jgi:hypothetical protein
MISNCELTQGGQLLQTVFVALLKEKMPGFKLTDRWRDPADWNKAAERADSAGGDFEAFGRALIAHAERHRIALTPRLVLSPSAAKLYARVTPPFTKDAPVDADGRLKEPLHAVKEPPVFGSEEDLLHLLHSEISGWKQKAGDKTMQLSAFPALSRCVVLWLRCEDVPFSLIEEADKTYPGVGDKLVKWMAMPRGKEQNGS